MYLLSISIFCSTVVFSQLGEDGAKPQAKPAVSSVGPPGPGAPAVPLPAVSASEHQRKKSAFGPQSSGSGAPAPDPGPVPGGPLAEVAEDPAEEAMNEMIQSQGQAAGGGGGLSRADTMSYQSSILKKGPSRQFG